MLQKNLPNILRGLLLVAASIIAFSTCSLSNRASKVEDGFRIVLDQVDCQEKCPKHAYDPKADNYLADKCSSECDGSTKYKLRLLVK